MFQGHGMILTIACPEFTEPLSSYFLYRPGGHQPFPFRLYAHHAPRRIQADLRKRTRRSNLVGFFSLLGFVLPLTSAIIHSANVSDCMIWSVIAMIVQVIVYFVVRIPVPNLSNRIATGELAPAIGSAQRRSAAGALERRLDDVLKAIAMKRSSQVALLLMGTTGCRQARPIPLMPKENCSIDRPAIVTPAATPVIECAPRSNSSSSSGSYRFSRIVIKPEPVRSRFIHTNKSTGSGSSTDSGGHVTRGGFGSFAPRLRRIFRAVADRHATHFLS